MSIKNRSLSEVAMQAKRIQVGQIFIQIHDYDHPGEPVIFLHFSGANLMMWQRVIPVFQEKYRLILVDLRGHGKSDQPPAGYHMDSMAQDVVGLMDVLGLERVHIIGSSIGAEVGLSLASNYSQRVLSLVCDGALSSEFGPYSTWEGSRDDYEAHVARQLERMHNTPESIYPSVDALVAKSRAALEELGWWNEDVETMERYGAHQLDNGNFVKAFRKFAREDYFKQYFHYRLEDNYRRVSCPLLMLPGADVLENEAERTAMLGLSQLAPHAQIAAVGGWVHPYGWLLDPGGACQEILSFLS